MNIQDIISAPRIDIVEDTATANLHGIWKTNSIMNDSFCYYQNKPTEIYQYRCTNRNSWTNLCNGVYIFEMTKLLPSATDTLELQ